MALQDTSGIVPGELSPLLWNSPLITVQMLSEFIERLPFKHKEKIWKRHSKGQHIPKDKILDVLHSFVALCIKIKSQDDIENTLSPFVDVVGSQTASLDGMCHSEFNNELHFWLLEPVNGLSIVNEEQRKWMEQINHIREELINAQNDNAELHKIIHSLQDEAKENKLELERITFENIELRKGRDKTRESEDDEDEEEVTTNGMTVMDPNDEDDDDVVEEVELIETTHTPQTPQLIVELQEKPLADFETLQTEAQFVEERMSFQQTDQLLSWKSKALESEEKVLGLEIQRKASFEEIDTLTQTVRQLQQEHEAHIQQYKNEVAAFKKKHKEQERIRRSSVAALHENLFAKLNEAEAEHDEITADYQRIIAKLEKANTAYAKQLLHNNVEVTKLKQEIHDLTESKADQRIEHESIIEQYKNEIESFRKRHKEQERIRRSSISALHDNLLGKLLEAEADHAEVTRDYEIQIGELQEVKVKTEKTLNVVATTKVDSIKNAANSIQELRDDIKLLSKKYQFLLNKYDKMTSTSAVQHFRKSVTSLFGL